MNPDLALAVVGSSTFTAVVVTLINGLMNRKKLGAEATEIITKAASGVVERLEGEVAAKTMQINRHESELNTCRRRESNLERRVRDLEQQLAESMAINQLHVAWDFLAYKELEAGGTDLPPPPALSPPPKQFKAYAREDDRPA